VAYAHDADANPINVSAGLLTMAGSFTLPGFTPSRNWYTASLGVMARFSPTLTGYVAYNGRFNDSSQKINALNLGVQFAF
jgi:outer membrane lipase/esterase